LSKKILFSRHAKSSWGKLGSPDHDRPLNQRGLENAHLMGSRLSENRVLPDLFVSSPAKRALDTCKIIKNEISVDGEIKIFNQIYTDGVDGISSSIQLINN
jgi:phosphohistidine phosphatase